MVTEHKFECEICGLKNWRYEIPEECPDCLSTRVTEIDTRSRDESNGECSVGAPPESSSDINCQLIATHIATIDADTTERQTERKICDKHKRMWDGSKHVADIRKL